MLQYKQCKCSANIVPLAKRSECYNTSSENAVLILCPLQSKVSATIQAVLMQTQMTLGLMKKPAKPLGKCWVARPVFCADKMCIDRFVYTYSVPTYKISFWRQGRYVIAKARLEFTRILLFFFTKKKILSWGQFFELHLCDTFRNCPIFPRKYRLNSCETKCSLFQLHIQYAKCKGIECWVGIYYTRSDGHAR